MAVARKDAHGRRIHLAQRRRHGNTQTLKCVRPIGGVLSVGGQHLQVHSEVGGLGLAAQQQGLIAKIGLHGIGATVQHLL